MYKSIINYTKGWLSCSQTVGSFSLIDSAPSPCRTEHAEQVLNIYWWNNDSIIEQKKAVK